MVSERVWLNLSKVCRTDPLANLVAKMDAPIYDVFLGGSCGKTDWRDNVVVPRLRNYGITYFNPQSRVWTPDLIGKEESAKLNSRYLLFVIHPSTTNAASVIEIAHLAAADAPLVIVVEPDFEDWVNNAIPQDKADRKRVAELLYCILLRHNIPMFGDFDSALNYLERQIVGKRLFSDGIRHRRSRRLYLQLRLDMLRGRCREMLTATMNNVMAKMPNLSCYYAKQKTPSSRSVNSRRPINNNVGGAVGHYWRVHAPPAILTVMTVVFALLLVNSRQSASGALSWLQIVSMAALLHTLFYLAIPPILHFILYRGFGYSPKVGRVQQPNTPQPHSSDVRRRTAMYDVCLLGPVGHQRSWIEDQAVPHLRRRRLSYASDLTGGCPMSPTTFNQRLTLAAHSRAVLYKIVSAERFLSGAVEMAYMSGCASLKSKLIACIPSDSCIIPLNERRRKQTPETVFLRRNTNYYRALSYLSDILDRKAIRRRERVDDALRVAVTVCDED